MFITADAFMFSFLFFRLSAPLESATFELLLADSGKLGFASHMIFSPVFRWSAEAEPIFTQFVPLVLMV
jgi:hypothetical protein